jgi:hypothetical protein
LVTAAALFMGGSCVGNTIGDRQRMEEGGNDGWEMGKSIVAILSLCMCVRLS